MRGEDSNLPDEAIPGFEVRSMLRPGLTGIAQIFAPRDVPRRQKYEFDAIYAGSHWFMGIGFMGINNRVPLPLFQARKIQPA